MSSTAYDNFLIDYMHRIDDVAEVREDDPWEVILVFKDGSIKSYWLVDRTLRTISKDGSLTDQDYAKEFGLKLSHIMYRKGIMQSDLARTLGVDQSMVSRYLSGKTILNLCQIRRIAKALDMPVESLLLKF